MTLAPILLFVYNRPQHTRRGVESLLHNDLARDSRLIIYSDAPKTATDADSVSQVREYIHSLSLIHI